MAQGPITVVINPPDLAERLRNIPSAVIGPEFRRAVLEAEAGTKLLMRGPVLHVRTGRLWSSVTSKVTETPDMWTGVIGSNVVYAPIHEFGGIIPAHRVVPKNARVLRFVANGQTVFAKYADIPIIRIPQRPTFVPSAQKAMDDFVKRVESIDLVQASHG